MHTHFTVFVSVENVLFDYGNVERPLPGVFKTLARLDFAELYHQEALNVY